MTDVCGVVVTEKTLGLVLCCSLLSSLSLCNLSYSSRISAGVLFLSTTYTASSPQGIGNEDMFMLNMYNVRQRVYVRENIYLPAFHLQPFLPEDVIDGSGVSIAQHWRERGKLRFSLCLCFMYYMLFCLYFLCFGWHFVCFCTRFKFICIFPGNMTIKLLN